MLLRFIDGRENNPTKLPDCKISGYRVASDAYSILRWGSWTRGATYAELTHLRAVNTHEIWYTNKGLARKQMNRPRDMRFVHMALQT